MKIAIAGCGIAGTATGAFLARDGHDVTVFEQAEQCQPIGAGIMLQPSGQAIADELGVLDSIQQRSARLDGLDAFLTSGRPLIRLRYEALGPNTFALGVHRGRLFTELLQACENSGARVVTSTAIARHHIDSDAVHLVDEDGQTLGPFDFVIAADGARSKLRAASGIRHHQVLYQYAALWTTGPCTGIPDRLCQVIDGTQQLLGLLPIGEGQCSFFWGLRSTDYASLIDRGFDSWKTVATQVCPQSAELLQTIDSFDQLTFSGYRHVRMKSWHTDRVLFVGDAAHPSSPHLGQGVNLALEDASCFATALRQCNNFDQACKLFHKRRAAKIRYYQQLTRLLTPFFQSDIPLLALGRNIALPWFPRIPYVRTRMLQTLCGITSGWLG
ncbi:FAD-dependent oxidoreductase [Planctomycetes bacterium K23_9]|uniref:3-hydroxybenzoate 6-hydroxylase 1 n=1 Tax=Stieleria marina TaxID=1930275 RepID=A0A517NS89_9BACT|nr:3-hydroxybenzoate 6-hydroxylase 1 [Planctomycetes bacterium K23_9]